MKMKKFDCVELKRKGAARVKSETEHLNAAERLAYWEKGTAELRAEQEVLRRDAKQNLSQGGSGNEVP